MSYPPSQYPGAGAYTPPSGPSPGPRRNLGMISAVVIVCTAVVLGSILTVAFLVNRGSASNEDAPPVADSGDDISDDGGDDSGDEGHDTSGEGDPEQIAVTVIEIVYGMSEESPDELICSEPGPFFADVESTRETISESMEELGDLIDEVTAMDSYEEGETMQVEVGMVVLGTETALGTVELIVEDGSWRACDFTL